MSLEMDNGYRYWETCVNRKELVDNIKEQNKKEKECEKEKERERDREYKRGKLEMNKIL